MLPSIRKARSNDRRPKFDHLDRGAASVTDERQPRPEPFASASPAATSSSTVVVVAGKNGAKQPHPSQTGASAPRDVLPPLLKNSEINLLSMGTLLPPRPGEMAACASANGQDQSEVMANYTETIGQVLRRATRNPQTLHAAAAAPLHATDDTYTSAGTALHVGRMQRFPFHKNDERLMAAAVDSLIAADAMTSTDEKLSLFFEREAKRRDDIQTDSRLSFRTIVTEYIQRSLPLKEAFDQSTKRTAMLNRAIAATAELQITEATERILGEKELFKSLCAMHRACIRIAKDVAAAVRLRNEQLTERQAFEARCVDEKQHLFTERLLKLLSAMTLLLTETEEPCREGVLSQERRAHMKILWSERDDAFDVRCDRYIAVRERIEAEAIVLEQEHLRIREEIVELREKERYDNKQWMMAERQTIHRDVFLPRRLAELVAQETTTRRLRGDHMLQSLWRASSLAASELFVAAHVEAVVGGDVFDSLWTPAPVAVVTSVTPAPDSTTSSSTAHEDDHFSFALRQRFDTSAEDVASSVLPSLFTITQRHLTHRARMQRGIDGLIRQEAVARNVLEESATVESRTIWELAGSVAPIVAALVYRVLHPGSIVAAPTTTTAASESRSQSTVAVVVHEDDSAVEPTVKLTSGASDVQPQANEVPRSSGDFTGLVLAEEVAQRDAIDRDAESVLVVLRQLSAMSSVDVSLGLCDALFCDDDDALPLGVGVASPTTRAAGAVTRLDPTQLARPRDDDAATRTAFDDARDESFPPCASSDEASSTASPKIGGATSDQTAVAPTRTLEAPASPLVATPAAVAQEPPGGAAAVSTTTTTTTVTETTLWSEAALRDAIALTAVADPTIEGTASAPAVTRPHTTHSHTSSRAASRHALVTPNSPFVPSHRMLVSASRVERGPLVEASGTTQKDSTASPASLPVPAPQAQTGKDEPSDM